MDPLLTLSGAELARRIRAREVTSARVVDAHIRRIERVNPTINALVAPRFEAAREEARAADARIAAAGPAEVLPPYLGVPCTIKEAFALTGMPNTSGLRRRAGRTATADATAVARLRAAGAIPLGVTNLSELCMWYESHNKVYGRSRNPYDARRTVGGSSGGEGAIIGAGASPFGLGADIGGSIRMPAFFNGVFGHKPTGGMVPNTGQHPLAENDALRYLCTGPLARRAEDLMPLLRILAGPDGEDPSTRGFPLGDPAAVDVSGLTVVDVPDGPVWYIHPELKDAQRRVVRALADRGARVVSRRFSAMADGLAMWSALLDLADGTPFKALMGEGEPIDLGRELARTLAGRSEHTLPAVVLAAIEKVPRLFPGQSRALAAKAQDLRAELVDAMGDGVMILPSHPRPAPRHRWPLLLPTAFACTAILNVLELPATQVPAGLSRGGLPVGVQVAGPQGADHRTIKVAMVLEEALGGWMPPAALREEA